MEISLFGICGLSIREVDYANENHFKDTKSKK